MMKLKKKQKLLVVLPLLALPFVTLLFWTMGGGGGPTPMEKWQGLNLKLPEVSRDQDDPKDKMSYYKQAASDSAKWKEQAKNDPYYKQVLDESMPKGEPILPEEWEKETGLKPAVMTSHRDPNEEKVYQKLAELEQILDRPDSLATPAEAQPLVILGTGASPAGVSPAAGVKDIERLEQMMEQMTTPETEDPELQQLNQMLETILDIQHPGRVQQKLEQASRENKGQVFAVSSVPEENPVSLLDQQDTLLEGGTSFYGLEDFPREDVQQNAVAAVIHETQSLMAGSTVKLRLTQDIYIEGVRIPKGHFVFGTAEISGERLDIAVDGIRYQNSLFPVELIVYSMDGIQGLHIPGAITRKVAKESAGQAVQGFGLTSFDTSLEAQAASVGIEATRNLLSNKAKLIKVTVKAGDRVLLKDKKQKNY
ncbi:conjugative transposon protein TraM [Sinomicrobium weinanense]|uniref:Conjugative transposon protein TraM n=1 Tax=Sinomicrobium weinanense TaxID=2842200 RepID=A0A926JUF8_9FLAO|nr:conjugative transposon protein TraM [Sinomicrobium weinanense]MBC9797581.1 conjugative transposon protein TraM [Sinomicrobium weinanense]MBU3123648.1 conjugative transposon protein TraM [Sinomicrobium weinanense]